MKLAIISVLLGALSGTAFADEAVKSAPRGYVTIQEIPVMFVEAKRWNTADEQMLHKSQNTKIVSQGSRRDVAYAAR